MELETGDQVRIIGSNDPHDKGTLAALLGVDFYRIDHPGGDTYIKAWGWEIERAT